ncbi:MAG: hypothetical protein KJ077_22285 [Anaerolineae bacterium]|nr:hypothetical protein [Anaerolineae bacterium]
MIKATPDQTQKIRLLSDGVLYREALEFIKTQGIVDGQKQMTSLTRYTQSWADLTHFVEHQEERDWPGKRAYYKQFYAALRDYLKSVRQRVEAEWFPPPRELTKTDKQQWLDHFSILVGREFAQHLAAENLYREKVQ